MLRAGLIKRLASGLYSWMPLGYRVLKKVERIVREEMDRAGAIEAADAGGAASRAVAGIRPLGVYGKELLRLKDRHEREFCVGPPTKKSSPTSCAKKCAATSSCR